LQVTCIHNNQKQLSRLLNKANVKSNLLGQELKEDMGVIRNPQTRMGCPSTPILPKVPLATSLNLNEITYVRVYNKEAVYKMLTKLKQKLEKEY
jgi:hypothetical protein